MTLFKRLHPHLQPITAKYILRYIQKNKNIKKNLPEVLFGVFLVWNLFLTNWRLRGISMKYSLNYKLCQLFLNKPTLLNITHCKPHPKMRTGKILILP